MQPPTGETKNEKTIYSPSPLSPLINIFPQKKKKKKEQVTAKINVLPK